jgi:hypothetical protein
MGIMNQSFGGGSREAEEVRFIGTHNYEIAVLRLSVALEVSVIEDRSGGKEITTEPG